MTDMYCHNCGNPIRTNAKFCQSCGTKIESQPEDLVAQKVETLDLSDGIAVNNDAQIEGKAEWRNDSESKAIIDDKPQSRVIIREHTTNGWVEKNVKNETIKSKYSAITTYKAKELKIAIQCGSVRQKSIYWVEDSKGNLVSDYYDWIELEMKEGVCVAKKDDKYGLIIWKGDKMESVTPFIFDKIEHYANGLISDWLSKQIGFGFGTFDDVRYNGKECKMIWFSDGIQLFDTITVPERIDWPDTLEGIGKILLFLAFIKGIASFKAIGKFNFSHFFEELFSGGIWWLIIIAISIIAGIILGSMDKVPEHRYLKVLKEYPYDMDEHERLDLPEYAEFK